MSKRNLGLCISLIVLAACEGGGDGIAQQPEPIDVTCDSTSVLENGACRVVAERIDARATTPFTENGEPVELEVVLFKPLQGERFPLLVVNHGSTGSGSDPSLSRRCSPLQTQCTQNHRHPRGPGLRAPGRCSNQSNRNRSV